MAVRALIYQSGQAYDKQMQCQPARPVLTSVTVALTISQLIAAADAPFTTCVAPSCESQIVVLQKNRNWETALASTPLSSPWNRCPHQ